MSVSGAFRTSATAASSITSALARNDPTLLAKSNQHHCQAGGVLVAGQERALTREEWRSGGLG
jgi:hypothetical protein